MAVATSVIPPLIIPQGVSAAIGWFLFGVLDRGLKVDDATLMWTIFPGMGVIFIAVDVVSKKMTPRLQWSIGILGWITALGGVWLFQLSLIK